MRSATGAPNGAWAGAGVAAGDGLGGGGGAGAARACCLALAVFRRFISRQLLCGWKDVMLPLYLCIDAHCFNFWDLPWDVLAAPESALGLDRCNTSLSLSLSLSYFFFFIAIIVTSSFSVDTGTHMRLDLLPEAAEG